MPAKQTFEKSMEQLETIIKELEGGDLPLEKAIERFEEGIKLSKFCSDKLDETEKRISVLMQEIDGCLQEVPYEAEDDR